MQNSMATDLVVTVPMHLWLCWLAEGDLPDDPPEESQLWDFATGRAPKDATPGVRVYVVAHGHLRGYAPLVRVEPSEVSPTGCSLVRGGGAVACTIVDRGAVPARVANDPILAAAVCTPMAIPGFRGVRKRWWKLEEEVPFPDWATHGLPQKLAADVRCLLRIRKNYFSRMAIQQRALGGGFKPTIDDFIDAANGAKMRESERAADAEVLL